MSHTVLRRADISDAARILEIYTPYITDTNITFEYDSPTLEEFSARIRTISADYPYLVCTVDDLVAGYAYAHRHMERAAYQWNAELSIYLAPRFRGAGLGTALYTALIEILRQMHVRNAYGCVTLPNEGSAGLHKSMGFSLLGIFHHTGYKLGAWHDVGWFERPVCQGSEAPLPLLSVQDISDGQIRDILAHCKRLIQTDVLEGRV